MNFRKALYIGIDAFLTLLIIGIATKIGFYVLKIPVYWFSLLIIDVAISLTILFFINRKFIKLIRRIQVINNDQEIKSENISENEIELKEGQNINTTEEIKSPENNIAQGMDSDENIKKGKYISKKIRIPAVIGAIFIGILAFLEIMFHVNSFKGNLKIMLIVVGVLILFSIAFFSIRWYFRHSDKETPEPEENGNVEEEKKEEEIEETKEEPIGKRRILINDDSWKEFHLPKAEGNPFSDYTQLGESYFIDVANWDVHALIKELEMFDPALKNDMYYKHKAELFMKVNDRDYRYPRVSQKDMLRPEEILVVQLNPVEIEKDVDEDEMEKEGEK